MKFRKLKSNSLVDVPISEYLIKWDTKSCSSYQTSVKNFLKSHWKGQQVLEEFRIPGSLLRIDFINLNKKIVIEVDGEFHEEFSEFAHKNRANWWKHMKRDVDKMNWCEECGYKFVQIKPDDIKNLNLEWFRKNYQLEIV